MGYLQGGPLQSIQKPDGRGKGSQDRADEEVLVDVDEVLEAVNKHLPR